MQSTSSSPKTPTNIMQTENNQQAQSAAASSSSNQMQRAPEESVKKNPELITEAIHVVYRGRLGMAFSSETDHPAESIMSLTKSDKAEFKKLENVFEKGVAGMAEGYKALDEIRSRRLYRESHQTFDAYCLERWGFSAKQAYRTIAIGKTLEELSPFGDIGHLTTEAQIRPLTALPNTEAKVQAMQLAVQLASGGKVTGKDVAEAAKTVKARASSPSIKG